MIFSLHHSLIGLYLYPIQSTQCGVNLRETDEDIGNFDFELGGGYTEQRGHVYLNFTDPTVLHLQRERNVFQDLVVQFQVLKRDLTRKQTDV